MSAAHTGDRTPYFDNVRGRLTALESHLRNLAALLERVDV